MSTRPNEGAAWLRRIKGALAHLGGEFGKNELAYLALTSKAEKPIVDRLAFRLQRDHGGARTAVAREYTNPRIARVDLAVVVDRMPRLLLEAKATHAFNARREQPRFRADLRADAEKLRGYQADDEADQPTKVVLLLTTYTHPLPEQNWDRIVKYAAEIRRHHRSSIEELKSQLDKRLPEPEFVRVASGDIPGGRAFDIDVTIHYRLLGPFVPS